MPDTMTSEQRHNCMSHIRAKNTKPELLVRRFLHGAGFRYRIHVKRLPGCPDIVLPKYRTIIFVNGCFWHGHRGCCLATHPKTHPEFWESKIAWNIRRDELNVQTLESLDWKVITVWECELKKAVREATFAALAQQIRENGAIFTEEQLRRRRSTAEHRAMLRAARERHEAALAELAATLPRR